MSNLITFAVTAVVTATCFLYYYEIAQPVREEQKPPRSLRDEWIDFINANIIQSKTTYHCHQCRKMIMLFDLRFRKVTPPQPFMEYMENLYNRLDTRYKCIKQEDDGLSNLTSDDVQNMIIN